MSDPCAALKTDSLAKIELEQSSLWWKKGKILRFDGDDFPFPPSWQYAIQTGYVLKTRVGGIRTFTFGVN